MSRKDESLGMQSSAMSEGGPWGVKEEDAPSQTDSGGPRNPWTPPRREPSQDPERGPSAFDELMRRARGSFGGHIPGRPNPSHIWLYVAGALALIWLLLTCVHSIGEAQRGLVSQLGSYSRTLEPGLNMTLPAPFETVRIVDTGEVHSFAVGASGNGENLVLTADQDLLDLAYSVNWTVSDARQYAFQLANPEQVVRQAAQSAMRAVIAGVRLNDAIVWERKSIEQQAQARLQAILDGYDAGIRIQAIAINRAEPPHEVTTAAGAVDAARKASDGYIRAAKAYAAQKAASAEREAADFDDIYAQYKIAPDVTKRRLYYETMEAVLKGANKTVVDANGVTLQLPPTGGMSRAAALGGGGK